MFFVVILETDRQGGFEIDADGDSTLRIYNVEPFLVAIHKSVNQPTIFNHRLRVKKGEFRGYIDIKSELRNVGIYTFPVYSDDGFQTAMLSKFDIQLVTPYEGDLEDPIEMEFPQKFAIGHRGNGMNKVTNEILENTIPSFKKAVSTGADFVEFDVQFTSDNIPVIFHDFTLKSKYTYKKAEYIKKENGVTEYAIRQLSLRQFKKTGLKTDFQTPHNSLHDLLVGLPEDVSFDVEMKSIYEEPHLFDEVPYPDRNELIDAVLEELEAFGNDRKLFFSSFDPMMIIMLTLKQKKYPVLQLSCQESFEEERVAMSRLLSLSAAYKCMNVRGFVLDSDLVLKNKDLIQNMKKNYMICTYGKHNIQDNTVLEQLELGVRGICTDSISHVSHLVHSYK